jgi:hypothetical protein
VSRAYGPSLLIFVEPPGADPHAVVVWGGCAETRILTRFIRQLADEPWAPVAQGHPGAENRFDQRPATPQFKQPSSTTKSDRKHEHSFNPQPTARKSLFCTHEVLSIAMSLTPEI